MREQIADHYGRSSLQTLARTEDYPPVNQYGVQLRSNLPPEYWRQSPNHNPYAAYRQTTEDTEEGQQYDAPPVKRSPSSVRKYKHPVQNTTALAPAPYQTEQPKQHRLYMWIWQHKLLAFVTLLLLFFLGWTLGNVFSNWLKEKIDDMQFGNPRTFQLDANFGHNGLPSHITAQNLGGTIQVVETQLPQNATQKPTIHAYVILALDKSDSKEPVTLEVQDLNGDGKLDLVATVKGIRIPLYNNGQGFQSQPPTPSH